MIWTAWNNGDYHPTGAGYGFKLTAQDRDRHLDRSWQSVFIELPSGEDFITVEANIAKESFWGSVCRELINGQIGRWFLDEGYAPWTVGDPPRFQVEPMGNQRFRVSKRLM